MLMGEVLDSQDEMLLDMYSDCQPSLRLRFLLHLATHRKGVGWYGMVCHRDRIF